MMLAKQIFSWDKYIYSVENEKNRSITKALFPV